ncbi:MAG TPA: polysaccharide deacetylase family protein [Euzebyales bacterium]|nr:polysaccharide deacetylase family protein [Euzebyales bacterium]
MPLPILMYHSIARVDHDPNALCVPPERFAQQLATLRAVGLRGVGVGELLAARRRGEGRNLVGLTFDDGYADFLTAAVPILEDHGCGATVYVLSGRPGGTNAWDPEPRLDLLTGDQIREVAQRGMEVGSHGRLHQRLTDLTADALEAEIAGSRDELAGVLGTAPAGFCYPYGAVDAGVLQATAAAGYVYACAVKVATPSTFALRRFFVGPGDHPAKLLLKLGLDGLGLYGREGPRLPTAAAPVH